MKVLVTGAAGFIGSHLAEKLCGLDFEVYCLDNFSDFYPEKYKRNNESILIKSGLDVLSIDLVKDDLISKLPKDISYIFHLAGQPGNCSKTSIDSYIDNNYRATKNLIRFSKTLQELKLFVNISTSSVYGVIADKSEISYTRPISEYGRTKLLAEEYVLNNLEKSCSLRLFSVYGSRERPDKLCYKLIDSILNNKEFTLYMGSESHKRSYTHIEDILSGILSVIGREKNCITQIFNIGSDYSYTTMEIIDMIEILMKNKVKLKILSARKGDQKLTSANIDKAKELLRFYPKIDLKEGLIEEIEWAKNFLK